MQELAGPACGAADPAAPREELERVEREDEARLALEAAHELVDLLVGRSRSRRRWTPSASIAIAAEAVAVSITRTRPPDSSAACCALSYVPESLAETVRTRMRS